MEKQRRPRGEDKANQQFTLPDEQVLSQRLRLASINPTAEALLTPIIIESAGQQTDPEGLIALLRQAAERYSQATPSPELAEKFLLLRLGDYISAVAPTTEAAAASLALWEKQVQEMKNLGDIALQGRMPRKTRKAVEKLEAGRELGPVEMKRVMKAGSFLAAQRANQINQSRKQS